MVTGLSNTASRLAHFSTGDIRTGGGASRQPIAASYGIYGAVARSISERDRIPAADATVARVVQGFGRH